MSCNIKEFRDEIEDKMIFEGLSGASNLKLVIGEILKKLSPMQRKIIKLKFWGGQTVYEISSEMDMSMQAIENELHRSYTSLRQYIKKEAFKGSNITSSDAA